MKTREDNVIFDDELIKARTALVEAFNASGKAFIITEPIFVGLKDLYNAMRTCPTKTVTCSDKEQLRRRRRRLEEFGYGTATDGGDSFVPHANIADEVAQFHALCIADIGDVWRPVYYSYGDLCKALGVDGAGKNRAFKTIGCEL